MNPSNKFKILWVDADPLILAAAERLLHYQPWTLIKTSSVEQAKKELSGGEVTVVIADQRMPETTGIQLLNFAKEVSPTTTRILLTGFLENDVIETAINEANVFRFLTKPWVDEEIVDEIQKAIQNSVDASSKKNLMKEASSQNKKLEGFTSDLEKLVDERTQHIEKSKNQMERNLAKMRKLVLFIKELSGIRGLDELLLLVKKEIKKFHEVGNPILVYQTHDDRKKALYFHRREIIETKINEFWPESPRIRQNSQEDQIYLTRQLSRPVAKVIAIPLQRMGWGKSEVPSVLYIENDLPQNKIDFFLEFISQRIQPIAIAVDRILLEYQAKFVSYQWESTFDGIESPIAIVDKDYQLLRSNQSFSQEEGLSGSYMQFENQQSICPVKQSIASGKPSFSKVHSHGKIFSVLSYPINLGDRDEGTHVINYYVDITHSRKLYSKVIQNEKLGAIGLLAGNIAHELNNPLTGIRSLAQVLLQEFSSLDDKQLFEDMKEIEKAAERSQVIIKNLLDFSKPDETEDLVVVDLNDIVNRTLPLLKTAMRNFNSEIELSSGPGMVKVKMPLLQQVFFNLVTNACQAMGESGRISVKTKVKNGYVQLLVEDTGPGIPESVQQHIFEPFFTTKKEGEGTGLGLSMSSSIVERFGGKIEVSSQLSEGTCFTVSLPVVN